MVEKRKRTRTQKALELLKTGGVLREDSDDELGTEDLPWDWIYGQDSNGSSKSVVGAKMGSFECAIGDTVLLKAAGNEAWVALVVGFSEGETEDDDGGTIWSKQASFLWFSSQKEIKNSARKRHDCLPVGLCSQCLHLYLLTPP